MSFTQLRADRLRIVVAGALVALATAALPVMASAQPPAGQDTGGGGMARGGGGGRMMAGLFEGITLSDAQRKSIDSIRTAYQPQIAQARSGGDRAQARQLMRKQTDDFRSVLTPDQQATFDKNLSAMRSRMQRGGMGNGGGNPG